MTQTEIVQQIREKISALAGVVNALQACPTTKMVDYFDELKTALSAASAAQNQILGTKGEARSTLIEAVSKDVAYLRGAPAEASRYIIEGNNPNVSRKLKSALGATLRLADNIHDIFSGKSTASVDPYQAERAAPDPHEHLGKESWREAAHKSGKSGGAEHSSHQQRHEGNRPHGHGRRDQHRHGGGHHGGHGGNRGGGGQTGR